MMQGVRLTQEVYAYDFDVLRVLDLQGYDQNNWGPDDFHNHEIRVARTPDHVIAFAAYPAVLGKILQLKRFTVQLQYRRQGVGKRLMDYIVNDAMDQSARRITCIVNEVDLGSQLFLRAVGLKAIHLMNNGHIFFKRNI